MIQIRSAKETSYLKAEDETSKTSYIQFSQPRLFSQHFLCFGLLSVQQLLSGIWEGADLRDGQTLNCFASIK